MAVAKFLNAQDAKEFFKLNNVLYIWALPDDRPVRVETCSSWCVEYCDFN